MGLAKRCHHASHIVAGLGSGGKVTGHFEFVVDPDAESVDLDEFLAEFLLNCVRDQSGSSDQTCEDPDASGSSTSTAAEQS